MSTWAYDLFFGVPTDKNILGIASKDAVTKPAKQKEVSKILFQLKVGAHINLNLKALNLSCRRLGPFALVITSYLLTFIRVKGFLR